MLTEEPRWQWLIVDASPPTDADSPIYTGAAPTILKIPDQVSAEAVRVSSTGAFVWSCAAQSLY